ncbi:hypothetical protein PAAG_03611 [Paracoccidioides lutzii Pb01]|uniref:Extracellular serine-rich protein n=1 Tax=Paracoccidioides lutzii (strain ATCC MYA-826 / Pb01) TaxID=502779 RepID=C1GXN7_PARBA|nr:hypothetical protein PAAG_03611 [Paracoccidioides lutzii Pb01]EEH41325.1 hypothetical protein PAAG_03611 [Paracoccidioides lutzii Pb01]
MGDAQKIGSTLGITRIGTFTRTLPATLTSEYTKDLTTRSSSSSTKTPATHTVSVGPKSSLHAYVPNSVQADVGDVILFEFYPTNHSVVRADFDAPCMPASKDVFYSGHFQLGGFERPATWRWTVNTTEPTFFYCTAIGSCMKNGMVGAINPNSTMSIEDHQKKALAAKFQLEPWETAPAEGREGGTSPTLAPPHTHPLSGGAIAGIAIGSVVGIAILASLFFLLGRNAIYRKWLHSKDGRTDRTKRWPLPSGITGGGGLGGWSSGGKSNGGVVGGGGGGDIGLHPPPSEMGVPAVNLQPGHMSYISSQNSPHITGHLSSVFINNGNNASPGSQWGWDGSGSGEAGNVGNLAKVGDGVENTPHELAGGGDTGGFVELEGGMTVHHPSASVSPSIR